MSSLTFKVVEGVGGGRLGRVGSGEDGDSIGFLEWQGSPMQGMNAAAMLYLYLDNLLDTESGVGDIFVICC